MQIGDQAAEVEHNMILQHNHGISEDSNNDNAQDPTNDNVQDNEKNEVVAESSKQSIFYNNFLVVFCENAFYYIYIHITINKI